MIIGIPKEIKEQEQRVALLPSAASQLTRRGHSVVVQKERRHWLWLSDDDYRRKPALRLSIKRKKFSRAPT